MELFQKGVKNGDTLDLQNWMRALERASSLKINNNFFDSMFDENCDTVVIVSLH